VGVRAAGSRLVYFVLEGGVNSRLKLMRLFHGEWGGEGGRLKEVKGYCS